MLSYWASTTGEYKISEDELLEHAINMEHSYRPKFLFYGENARFFGIELEVNSLYDNTNVSAKNLLMGVNQHKRKFYCKRDGSLRHGFEFNSMPMTLDYFRDNFDADTMNALFDSSGVFATEDCGFHIHASREDLDTSDIARIYASMLNLPVFLHYITNRKASTGLERYASILPANSSADDREEFVKLCENNIKSYSAVGRSSKAVPSEFSERMFQLLNSADRYQALNLRNQRTIEFRFFRGTTNWGDVMFGLEFVDLLIEYARAGGCVLSVEHLGKIIKEQRPNLLNRFNFYVNNMVSDIRRIEQLLNRKAVVLNDVDSSLVSRALYRVLPDAVRKGDIAVPKLGVKGAIGAFSRMREALAVVGNDNGKGYLLLAPSSRSNPEASVLLSKADLKRDYIILRNLPEYLCIEDALELKSGKLSEKLSDMSIIPSELIESAKIYVHSAQKGCPISVDFPNETITFTSVRQIKNNELREKVEKALKAESSKKTVTARLNSMMCPPDDDDIDSDSDFGCYDTPAPRPIRLVRRPSVSPIFSEHPVAYMDTSQLVGRVEPIRENTQTLRGIVEISNDDIESEAYTMLLAVTEEGDYMLSTSPYSVITDMALSIAVRTLSSRIGILPPKTKALFENLLRVGRFYDSINAWNNLIPMIRQMRDVMPSSVLNHMLNFWNISI